MSNSTRKREPLGARRGATAARLAETAALDPKSLRPSRNASRDSDAAPAADHEETTGESRSPDSSLDGTSAESTRTSADPLVDNQPAGSPGQSESGGDVEVPAEDSSNLDPTPEPKPRPRADFRDALQILAWTTTQDLWDRYANLALQLRKDTGQRIATAEVIRAVLEQNMPNAETRTGVAALADYAERWTDLRARTRTTQKAQNFRLRRRDAEALERAQLSLLEDRGTNVAIGRMISGIVNENFPSTAEAKRLLKLP